MKRETDSPAQLRPAVGWRERVDLPLLKLFGIRAKVDTGARTSSLHVASVAATRTADGSTWLQLRIAYIGKDRARRVVTCGAQSAGMRRVKSSTGHVEHRHVILTTLRLGGAEYRIEVTLSDRSSMTFPMLIGREALRGRFLVDCGKSFLSDRRRKRRNKLKGERK